MPARQPPKARPEDGELLDGPGACRFLGVSDSTLRRLVASGKLGGQVVGYYNRRLYKLTALEAYVSGHTSRRRPAPPQAVPEDGELLDRDAACEFLGIAEATLRRRLASGGLTGQVLGPEGRRMYKRSALETYVAEQTPPDDPVQS